jgi:hypothetical protein
MTTLSNLRKKWILPALAVLAFCALSGPTEAQAGWGHGHSHGYRSSGYRSGPIYHGPSLHYDSVYHHEYSHWTPYRGWHSHGHYDLVPHYTPGHFDYQHRGHIHTNPWFHH